MDLRSLITKLAQINEATNPYKTESDRAKFDAMTPQDQAWLTSGGGAPDINDEFILNRAPNKGQPDSSKVSQQSQQSNVAQKVEQLKALLTKAEQQKSAPVAQPTPAAQAAQPARPAQQSQITQNQDGTFTANKKDGSTVTFDKNGKILSENTIAKNLVESFGYKVNEADLTMPQVAGAAGSGLAKAGLSKAGAKTVAKAIPGVGTTLSAVDAWNRFKEGDHTGAVISALAGAGWLIPGPAGWVIGGGLDAANVARDLSKETPQQAAQPAALGSNANPKIVALQKYLVSQGATNKDGSPLTVDGLMGPNTRAAMNAANLSESQKLEIVRMQLAEINEAAGWLGQAAKSGGKYIQGLKTGFKNLTPQQAAMAKNMAGTANKAGQATATAIKGPAGKVGALGAAGAVGYTAGATQSVSPPTTTASPTTTAAPTATASKGRTSGQGAQPVSTQSQPVAIDPELLKQIANLTAEVKAANSQDPAILAIISHAENVLSNK